MKTTSLKLPDKLDAELTAAVRRKGASKSSLLREAIERYLSPGEGGASGSVLELSKDLAGCVRGPADLSTGKKHLVGYGQ
ncbi:MAG TPA: CopG family transcriptional regulator [Acidobacteriota bacterium]|jgi:Arc/MetJ-type ribon-helix-helix transcriptional regulator|nr:CopG family transcriptional regulator [Acidobacteriota bacterium]